MKAINPFKFGKEVGGYQFYDRQADARFLRQKMIDGSSNVVLFVPRRYRLSDPFLGRYLLQPAAKVFAPPLLIYANNFGL